MEEMAAVVRKTARGRWLVRVLAVPTHEYDYRWLLCVLWSLEIYFSSYGYAATVARTMAGALVVVTACTYLVHLELSEGHLSRALQCRLGYLAAVPLAIVFARGLWMPYSRLVCCALHEALAGFFPDGKNLLQRLESAMCDTLLLCSAMFLYLAVMKTVGLWKTMQKRMPCHRVRFVPGDVNRRFFY